MAISVYFRRIAETPSSVTYEVRGDPEGPASILVIDKGERSRPAEMSVSATEAKAYGAILGHHERFEEWPAHGSRQS